VANLPYQLPVIWDAFIEEAQDEYASQQEKYDTSVAAYNKAIAAWKIRDISRTTKAAKTKAKKGDPKPKPPERPFVRMHKDEPEMFLKFATSTKLFMGSSVTNELLKRALELLYEYLDDFKRVSNQ